MKSYEGLFVFPPDATPDAAKSQQKNLDDLIVKFKGQITQKQEWGKKPLGYILKKFTEGHMFVYDFQMDPSQATDFRKALELQEDLLKYMITLKVVAKIVEKKPAKPAVPSVSSAKPVKTASAPTPAAS